MIASLHIQIEANADPDPYTTSSIYWVACDNSGESVLPHYVVVWKTPTDFHCVRLHQNNSMSSVFYQGYVSLSKVDSEGRPETFYKLPHWSSSLIRAETRIHPIGLINWVRFSLYTPIVSTKATTFSWWYKVGATPYDS